MNFIFPALNTSALDTESLRKVGKEIKLSTPAGTQNSAAYTLGYQKIGTKEIKNKLGVKPSRMQSATGPGHGTFSVSEWNKDKIILNITVAGKIDFWIYR